MLADRLFGLFSSDLAIDLGTANTLVFVRHQGIVLNEPSIIAIRKTDNTVIGVGHEAKAMLGRTPENIMAIRPLKDGKPGGQFLTVTLPDGKQLGDPSTRGGGRGGAERVD